MNDLPTKERFEGCLIGQCVGDALGFVVEGHHTVAKRATERATDEVAS